MKAFHKCPWIAGNQDQATTDLPADPHLDFSTLSFPASSLICSSKLKEVGVLVYLRDLACDHMPYSWNASVWVGVLPLLSLLSPPHLMLHYQMTAKMYNPPPPQKNLKHKMMSLAAWHTGRPIGGSRHLLTNRGSRFSMAVTLKMLCSITWILWYSGSLMNTDLDAHKCAERYHNSTQHKQLISVKSLHQM